MLKIREISSQRILSILALVGLSFKYITLTISPTFPIGGDVDMFETVFILLLFISRKTKVAL